MTSLVKTAMTDSDGPERPRLDQDVYIYSDEDCARIAGEVYARLRELEDVDDETAQTAATMIHDLLTGEWQADLHDDQ